MKVQDVTEKDVRIDLETEMITLFHKLESALPDTVQHVIQFTSSHHHEGVTTLSREFASVSSRLFGKSVLVLDASKITIDGTSHSPQEKNNRKYPTIKNSGNRVQALEGGKASSPTIALKAEVTEDYLKSIVENDIMPYTLQSKSLGGFHIGSLSELGTSVSVIFSDKYFGKFLGLFKEKYDLVIIDTPPVCESSVGLAVSRKVDGVVLVVAAETTRWPVIARVKEQIEKVGGMIFGVVLNKQKHHIPSYIYDNFL